MIMSNTLSHDLVDFAVFLAAHEFFMFVGKLNFDADLVLSTLHKGDLMYDHHCGFDGIVGSINGKCQLLEPDFCTRVGTDVRKHSSNIRR